MPYWIFSVWEWLKKTQLCQNKKSNWCKIISSTISNLFTQHAKIHHLKLLPVWQEQKLLSFLFGFWTQTCCISQSWPMGNFLKWSIFISGGNECKIWPKTILHRFNFWFWQSWVFLSLSQSQKNPIWHPKIAIYSHMSTDSSIAIGGKQTQLHTGSSRYMWLSNPTNTTGMYICTSSLASENLK